MTRTSRKNATPQTPAKRAHTLAQIADQIRTLEKRTISTVFEIGAWLEEAAEQCDHGTFMKWVATEFGWSHSTALNYRNVYALRQNRKNYEFEHPNITISGLYLAARFLKDDQPSDVQAAGNAILDAAKLRRVSYTEACDIADEHLNSKVDVGSQVDRDDSGADEPEEIEDEDSDETEEIEADGEPAKVGYQKDEVHQKLAKLSGSRMESRYTTLIKTRELYEGACELPWAQYFDYRDQHQESTARLTPEDIAYVRQWTSLARPSPSDMPAIADDASEVDELQDDDEAYEVRSITDEYHQDGDCRVFIDGEWWDVPKDADRIGPEIFRKIIATMQAAYDAHRALFVAAEAGA